MVSRDRLCKLILVLVVGCLLLSGCAGQQETGGEEEQKVEPITLVATHVLEMDHPLQKGFEKFKELVEERTDGQIQIEIYSSAVLAEESEALKALQDGTIDITSVSAAPVTGFVKEFMACDLPFLFANYEEAWSFYEGPVGDLLLEKAGEVGLVGLAWWENGFRNFTNNVRPIASPEDMRGLKIRTMASPVHMASVRALGADPTPIDFGELYTALQQGVVDGQENPIPNIYTSRFHEVQKYLTLSNHFHDPSPTFISAKTWAKLTSEQQQIMKEAALEAGAYMRQLVKEDAEALTEKLREEGIEVTELTPEQVKAFQEATKDVYKEFIDEIGADFLDQFLKGAGRPGLEG
jgi:tripartite ATP-independent transporter DctP family solute receptor